MNLRMAPMSSLQQRATIVKRLLNPRDYTGIEDISITSAAFSSKRASNARTWTRKDTLTHTRLNTNSNSPTGMIDICVINEMFYTLEQPGPKSFSNLSVPACCLEHAAPDSYLSPVQSVIRWTDNKPTSVWLMWLHECLVIQIAL
jgi:hypothetical protein